MSIANPQHPCILKERTFHVAHASFVRIIGPHIHSHTHIRTHTHMDLLVGEEGPSKTWRKNTHQGQISHGT